MVDARYTNVPADVECTFADHEPAISELFVTTDGTLWVQHSRSGRNQADGVLLTYDTFDDEGNYIQQVSVVCECDPAFDGLRFLGDGRVLLIKGYVLARWSNLSPGARADFGEEEAGQMEVICCRIVERWRHEAHQPARSMPVRFELRLPPAGRKLETDAGRRSVWPSKRGYK